MPSEATDQTIQSDQSNNNHPSTAYGLLTQLTTGPSSREVATVMLRAALLEQFPTLNLNPDLAMVVTPHWRVSKELIEPDEPRVESLTSILARQALAPGPLVFLEGEHFLTLQPNADPPLHLPVKIDVIARLINELASLLYTAFQEQQLDYWNGSYNGTGLRWKAFSSALRKVWNVTTVEGWDDDDCALARTLYHDPELSTRAPKDPYKSHAYLIDVDIVLPERQVHVGLLDIAVLVGTQDARPIILAYSLIGGYERFDSIEQLGATLPGRLNHVDADMEVQWRFYEPDENYFDSLACTLIGLQIEAIGALGDEVTDNPQALTLRRSNAARILPSIEDLSAHRLSTIREVHQHLPPWLTAASDLEIAAYSRCMIDLAQLHTHYHGRTFDEGIPAIRDYARTQLASRIKAHPKGANLNLDKVEVVIQTPVIWGTFVVPNAVDITRRSLIDLALENLTGLPSGAASVISNGDDAPEWLTYDYLKSVIESLDIGAHYPALIKQKLLDDPQESVRRRTLYTSHLRVQLPLLALQLKMQQRHGLDERGFLYVAAAMQIEAHERHVDGQPAVIRPLAFMPTLRPGHSRDVVANMYLIGPQDHTVGPCVLYCPMMRPMLLQFPSRQNLLYAIKRDPDLREAVLAWLPDDVRFNYGQYVFPDTLPSPWTAVRVLVEPATVLYMSGPVELSDDILGGDALDTLFKANADALVELATRQSVSNMQKRWDTLRRTGWQIFNAALPFLGRTVGVAAWIWQIMDDLQEAKNVVDDPKAQTSWTALVDMFLNLGMALALHVALRHPPEAVTVDALMPLSEDALDVLEELPKKTKAELRPITLTKLPDIIDKQLPPLHQGPLHVSGALQGSPTGLGTALDSFAVAKPASLGEQSEEAGVHLHLYPLADKWYAPVGQRWFEVTLDTNDNVMIVDPATPSRTGPLLINNLAGQWFIDTRLRLRGGGLRNRRRSANAQKPSRIETLRDELNAFDAAENSAQAQLASALEAIGSQPGPSTVLRREAFITQVNGRLEAYDVPIRQLRALSIIANVPNYQSVMVEYLNKQLVLTRTAVEERIGPFRDLLVTTVDALETDVPAAPQEQADYAQKMSTMNVEMIKRMEYVESRFRELDGLGAAGARVIQRAMRALPNIRVTDLKALQITIARYLCSATSEGKAQNDARTRLHGILDAVDISVQSFIEVMDKINGSPLEERIELLNSQVEQLTLGDQRLLDLHADYPEHLLREPLEKLRRYIDEFNQQAMQNLVQLLRERKALEPKPGPSNPPSTPQRKVIKTRSQGIVVGEPRATDSSLVDVKAPMTGKIIATFHEKTPGVWVERVKTGLPTPAVKKIDLDTSVNAGQALLDDEPASTRRLLGHSSKAGRIPKEIQEMFQQRAAKLEQAASDVDTALTQRNLTAIDRPRAAALNKNLTEAAARLVELGRSTRISMIKQQPPTAARLEWLRDKGQVTIKKVGARRRLKGPGKDYLDEYEIRDTGNKAVLWYAHFHYPSPQAAAEDFSAAHLKTREQQKLGGAFERKSANDRDQIAIYRSEISTTLAKSLFFDTAAQPSLA